MWIKFYPAQGAGVSSEEGEAEVLPHSLVFVN